MDNEEMKMLFQQAFDTVAEGYDSNALRFFSESAKHLPRYLDLKGDEQILDIATGTGHAAIALSDSLPCGRVTGIDFSKGMLARAKAKIEERGIRNVSLIPMDMQTLEFPDSAFDAAVFSFSLFFVKDMESLLCHAMRKVKSGGKVLATGFCGGTFSPQINMFIERIKNYGVEPPSAWHFSTPEECISLFEKAGLNDVSVDTKDLGYYLKNAGEWWDIIWYTGLRRYLNGLSESDLVRIKEEHLNEINSLRTNGGIWLEVRVLYARGVRQNAGNL